MARIYKSVSEMREYRQLAGITCDWCHAGIKLLKGYDDADKTLRFAWGRSFPDGGHLVGWQVEDLCTECIEKLRLLLIDKGINITPYEVDW